MREKRMDGDAERSEEIQLRHCPLLETLPAAHNRKWLPQPDPELSTDESPLPVLLGNELLTATPTPAPV